MNEEKNNDKPKMKKLAVGFIVDDTPKEIEIARFQAMKSILVSLITGDAIRVETVESKEEGKVGVIAYAYVKDDFPGIPCDSRRRINPKVMREMREKYPLFGMIADAGFDYLEKN